MAKGASAEKAVREIRREPSRYASVAPAGPAPTTMTEGERMVMATLPCVRSSAGEAGSSTPFQARPTRPGLLPRMEPAIKAEHVPNSCIK